MARSRDKDKKAMSEKTARKLLKEQKRARRAEKREAAMPYGLEHRRMENMLPQPPIGIKPSPLGVPTPYMVGGSDDPNREEG